jgi:two-component system cell cycle sensor histidine kinase/response regulator CckA
MSESFGTGAFDRSERPGRVGLLAMLAGGLVAVTVALAFVAHEQAQPFIIGLLAMLAVVGVFALFALSIGLVQVAGAGARYDLTRLICDGDGEGVVAVDESGQVVYANRAYLALTGASGPADLKAVDRLFTGAADVSDALYRLAQAAREERIGHEEIRLSPALGKRAQAGWYRVTARLLKRGEQKLTIWSVADITHERERQENFFQELQHTFDYLDYAPAGFLSIDPEGAIVYMNATLAAWLGHDLAKVGTGGLKLGDIAPSSAAAMIKAVGGLPGDVRTETLDLDLTRVNGQTLPVRLLHRVAFGSDGRPGASCTLALNRSPGEDSAELQRAAEVRFARFFNNSPLAIATVNRAGHLVRTNALFARHFGALVGPQGGGRSLASIVQEKDHAALQRALAEAERGRSDIEPIEVGIGGSDGRSARLFVSAVVDQDKDGEIAIVYALDTTEQRVLEAQFAQAQKMQAVGQLAGGVAHDFNNLLQAIIGYNDLLLTRHRQTDPSYHDLIQIRQNANRAASLVRQLLAYSRQQTLMPRVLDLGEVLQELSYLLRRLLGETVQLELKHERDVWPIRADSHQLEQVIVNLAVNARDAMPSGGKVSVRTANISVDDCARFGYRGMPAADYVMIEVEDTGTGIPKEYLDKIFLPFFTTKDVGKGTGLGLSTVYGIVKQTEGFIYCDSEPGKGTRFRIFLPRHIPQVEPVDADAPANAVTTDVATPAPAPDLTGRGVILYVEDEDSVRSFAVRALSSKGYTLVEASTGLEALERLEELDKPIDLIISDVMMPEMDGPTMLTELRARGIKAKIIFCSGYADDCLQRTLKDGEDFVFLAKPFDLATLVEVVKQALSAPQAP